METRKAKNFLLNHTCMYELISMDNSKYLVWKLMFPRYGDTFFTVDKSLDMCSWEKLYHILKRITLQYAVSSQLPLSSISVECCEFWYRLTIEKIPMDVECVHKFCGIDVDTNLLHDEILLAKVYNSYEFTENSTITEVASSGCALTTAESISRKRTYSVTSLSRTDERVRRISISYTPTRPSVSTQTGITSTPERKELFSISSTSSGGIVHTDCSEENRDDNIFLRYSDEEECEDESEDTGSNEKSSHSASSSDGTLSSNQSNESEKSETKTVERLKTRMDLFLLGEHLKDPKYLNAFCYEEGGIASYQNRTFNVYSVDDKISYAAFHSPLMVKNIRDRSDCKLFFCYSAEMLRRFHNFTEMQFEGISHVLMVYVNHISDRVRPFGYILLPNKNPIILGNVIKVVDQWLNAAGAVSTVTKCVTPQDSGLHQGIAETWPQAKLIGCSAEYGKDIKLFARRNKGLKSPNAELTRLACFLCFLPEIYISEGIETVRKSNPSEYAMKLAEYLRAKWVDRPISVYDEDVVYRSLTVCNQFNNHMMRKRFCDATNQQGQILKDCWDFIEFLKTESGRNSVEMHLDGTKLGTRWRRSFALNTKNQKERESHIVGIRKEFETNLTTSSQGDAVQQFLQQMVLYV